MRPKIVDVTEENRHRAETYLARHADTTMFLASNLARFGSRLTSAMNSGNFRLIELDGETCGVFCLARRGNLLAETGGRTDLAPVILDACESEPIAIRGIVGEWQLASTLWKRLIDSGQVTEQFASREPLYRLSLPPIGLELRRDNRVRLLTPDDFGSWQPLHLAYLAELNLPLQGSAADQRAEFEEKTAAGHWWGLFDDDRLIAIGGLNAVHESTGQIGGIYTPPENRRRGLARTLMHTLISDSIGMHGFDKLILFTGETDIPAQRLYESLGFSRVGEFGLLFGLPGSATGGHHKEIDKGERK